MRNGERAVRLGAVMRHPAAWIGAAVVLGAVGSWMAFDPPHRHVAHDAPDMQFGDLRDSPLPTLAVGNPLPQPARAPVSHDTPTSNARAASRAVFLTVEPADAPAQSARGDVLPAAWQSPTTPVWLTGTIEEISDSH